MVSGDVFRSPKDAMLLCVQLGSGVQIILASFITLFFAALGVSTARFPSHRSTMQHAYGNPVSGNPIPAHRPRAAWHRLHFVPHRMFAPKWCIGTLYLLTSLPQRGPLISACMQRKKSAAASATYCLGGTLDCGRENASDFKQAVDEAGCDLSFIEPALAPACLNTSSLPLNHPPRDPA